MHGLLSQPTFAPPRPSTYTGGRTIQQPAGADVVLARPVFVGQTFDPASQTLLWALSASTGALLVVAAVVVRVYLAWDYVGGRLLSATVDYEETGWCVFFFSLWASFLCLLFACALSARLFVTLLFVPFVGPAPVAG